MLIQLLRLIAESDGVVATSSLARKLGVSEVLFRHMVEELVHLGYLASLTHDCQAGLCSLCPSRTSCALPLETRLWILTEKGRRLVDRLPYQSFGRA